MCNVHNYKEDRDMSSINKVILLGRLGADPEMRYTTDGTPVATFRMVTSESYKDRSGEKQEKSEWHTVVAWRKLAEIIGEYLKKGKLVFIEGKIQSREYEGRDGVKRKVVEVLATDMKMMPDGGARGAGAGERRGGNSRASVPEDEFVPELEDDIPM